MICQISFWFSDPQNNIKNLFGVKQNKTHTRKPFLTFKESQQSDSSIPNVSFDEISIFRH